MKHTTLLYNGFGDDEITLDLGPPVAEDDKDDVIQKLKEYRALDQKTIERQKTEIERLKERLYDLKGRVPRWFKLVYGQPNDVSAHIAAMAKYPQGTGTPGVIGWPAKEYAWESYDGTLHERVIVIRYPKMDYDKALAVKLLEAVDSWWGNRVKMIFLPEDWDMQICEMMR